MKSNYTQKHIQSELCDKARIYKDFEEKEQQFNKKLEDAVSEKDGEIEKLRKEVTELKKEVDEKALLLAKVSEEP